jgi:hypothetical protein
MTEGLHYYYSYLHFSRLLGFDHTDRSALSLFDHYPNGVGRDEFVAVGLYTHEIHADGKNNHLKPYFYVLNNLLRATIDPKIGDSTTIQHHAPTILVCFGLDKRFSMIDLIWRNIQEVSLDPHKSLPYALYLMYIIEQVTGFSFAYDTNHLNWRIRNLGPHFGKGKGKATEASGSGAACASDDEGGDATTEDAPSPATGPRCGCGSSHGHGAGGATRHALRQFFSYFCYTQKNTDKHHHRLKELANLPPSSPLHEFLDPYVEYDARHGTLAGYE